MNHALPKDSARAALGILEQGMRLLRRTDFGVHGLYYVGTLPFLLLLVWFWAQMSRSPTAGSTLGSGALALALAYVWMKAWQALYVQRLMATLRDDDRAWSARHLAHVVLGAAILQPSGLLVTLVAGAFVLPIGWVIAFYHHALATGDPERSLWEAWDTARKQAQMWPRQNHLLLMIVALFGGFVFVNVLLLMLWLPDLIHTLSGIKTALLVEGWTPFNSTLLTAAAAVAFAAVDPLVKAAYALRSFQAEAQRTGRDLCIGLSRLGRPRAAPLGTAVLLLALVLPSAVRAQAPQAATWVQPTRPATAQVEGRGRAPRSAERSEGGNVGSRAWLSPKRLDDKIVEVLERPAFAWRSPRDEGQQEQRLWVRDVLNTLGQAVRQVVEWVGDALTWLLGWDNDLGFTPTSELGDWRRLAGRGTVLLALAAVAVPLVILWRRYRRRASVAVDQKVAETAAELVQEESLDVSRLPEHEWIAEGQRLLSAGERRLALRALFLSNVACLVRLGLITAAVHKSVGDYRLELGLRAHAHPGIFDAFVETAATFEAVYYGNYVLSEEALSRFSVCSARMRQDA